MRCRDRNLEEDRNKNLSSLHADLLPKCKFLQVRELTGHFFYIFLYYTFVSFPFLFDN